MRKYLAAYFFVAALACSFAQAQILSPIVNFGPPRSAGSVMKTPIVGFGGNASPSNSAANYGSLLGSSGGSGVWGGGTAYNREFPIPVAGVFSGLYVNFVTTLSQGSYSVAMSHNQSISGTLNCTIDTTHANCADNTSGDNITVAAGDTVGMVSTPTGTPTASANNQTAALFTSSNNNEGFLVGGAIQPSTVAVNWASINGWSAWFATNDVIASDVMAAGGKLDHLYVVGSTAPGAAKTYTLTVYQNGSATAINCTLSGAGSGAGITSCNDVSDSITISAGDTVSIESCPGTAMVGACTPVATPASNLIRWGMRWVPNTAGQSLLAMSDINTLPGTSGTTFSFVQGGAVASASEANNQNIGGSSFTIKNINVAVSTAPGAGTPSRTVTLRTAGSNSSVACTMTTLATCTNTNTASISAGTLLDFSHATASTPAAITSYKVGAVMTVP